MSDYKKIKDYLNNNFSRTELDSYDVYTIEDTSTVVALVYEDYIVSVVTKLDNSFGTYNYGFVDFINPEISVNKLEESIRANTSFVHATGDTTNLNINNNEVTFINYPYDSELKLETNPLYNRVWTKYNTKAISSLKYNRNKVNFNFEDITIIKTVDAIMSYTNHTEYINTTVKNVVREYSKKAR